jgi:hypothetical protein
LSWQIDVFDFLTAGSSAAAGAAAFAGAAAGAEVVAGAGAAGAAALASAGLGSAAKLEPHAKHKEIRAKRYVVFFMSIFEISEQKKS